MYPLTADLKGKCHRDLVLIKRPIKCFPLIFTCPYPGWLRFFSSLIPSSSWRSRDSEGSSTESLRAFSNLAHGLSMSWAFREQTSGARVICPYFVSKTLRAQEKKLLKTTKHSILSPRRVNWMLLCCFSGARVLTTGIAALTRMYSVTWTYTQNTRE